MGRPKNPTWTVEPFAPDANYPVGALPWSATPTKVAFAGAPSSGFVPKTGVPAMCLNYLFNAHATALIQAKSGIDALTTYVGELPALNFTASLPGGACRFAMVVVNNGQPGWYVMGDTCNLRASFDDGFSWGTGNSILADAGVAGGGENCMFGAADPATGNLLISTNSRYVFQSGSSGFTKTDVFGSGATGITASCCAFDPVHNLWVAASSGNNFYVANSADRMSWMTRTNPSGAALLALSPQMAMGVHPTSGRIVWAIAVVAESVFATTYSDDGGITWSTSTTHGMSIGNPNKLSLSYNPDTSEWFCVVGTTSAHKTEVWSSPDGQTWTRVSVLTTVCLVGCAPAGNMWVGMTAGGQVAYSLDDGVTWKNAGYSVVGSGQAAFSSNGQVIVMSPVRVALSLRAGEPGFGNFT